jgi:aspartate/methionine/tyrosine aminotransferase
MHLAQRLERLGTETAFRVSAEAAAFAAQGNKVYPFHLGDMNIRTPQNIIDAAYRALRDGKTGYCSNYGIPELRKALAADLARSHGVPFTAANVAIQPGGKPVIPKFIQALMDAGDEVLYPNPGYPIYESQIAFHGGRPVPYTYREGDGRFELDVDAIAAAVTPKTRLLILNDPQNPMGAQATPDELARIAELVVERDLFVLCDEAYFDLRYEGEAKSLASFPGIAERSLILYTFSKKFAMTGWRLGAAVGPEAVVDVVAKLATNDESCTNHFIQHAAIEALTGDQTGPVGIVGTLCERRDVAVDGLNAIDGVRCFRPAATFYLFPNVTDAMRRAGFDDVEQFRLAALQETGVSFCTRRHFGTPLPGETEQYIRFAYSGIDVDEIREGLGRLKAWIDGRAV